ncbi:hypothetical protein E2C01_051561 [Portunus trituberculatus]|uniref:Uncharacterized protein n=1 Tax=Portunus trituberculatus TaxID=210409 RepID=A0A5B7GKN1_PORTR|nr:hypothetical protein [Portunus trituberculatus]
MINVHFTNLIRSLVYRGGSNCLPPHYSGMNKDAEPSRVAYNHPHVPLCRSKQGHIKQAQASLPPQPPVSTILKTSSRCRHIKLVTAATPSSSSSSSSSWMPVYPVPAAASFGDILILTTHASTPPSPLRSSLHHCPCTPEHLQPPRFTN